MQEIEEKFNQLSTALVDWVGYNGLSLNIKKTNCMIFSRTRNFDHSTFQPKINNIPIAMKQTARFLGVLVDNKLKWKQHVHAVRNKMSRYLGIMYKLRHVLPQPARLTIFHSFVQSHLNYCALVWGFSAKSNIESLFRTQKKSIRATMTGYVKYFYKDGIFPSHTKSTFVEHKILTAHSIIIKNALLFMHKIYCFPSQLPVSIRNTIPDNAPSDSFELSHETCSAWLERYNNQIYRNSIFFKGPLLYTDMSNSYPNWNSCFSTNSLKKNIKRILREIQAKGDNVEWQADNFKLYNIQGPRKSKRIAQNSSSISYL